MEATVKKSALVLNILNDILDLSKLESGKFNIEYFPFNLKEMLQNLKFLFEPAAIAKNNKW